MEIDCAIRQRRRRRCQYIFAAAVVTTVVAGIIVVGLWFALGPQPQDQRERSGLPTATTVAAGSLVFVHHNASGSSNHSVSASTNATIQIVCHQRLVGQEAPAILQSQTRCATGTCSLQEYARAPFGDVLIMRHALAPGGGDPTNFRVDDCATQRNLDGAGRAQATDIGRALVASGLVLGARIFTSQWCRCRETAELIQAVLASSHPLANASQFQVLPDWGLNSFYQPSLGFTKEACMDRLENGLLVDIATTSAAIATGCGRTAVARLPHSLMVSHYVTVKELSGRAVSSGSVVAYDSRTKRYAELQL